MKPGKKEPFCLHYEAQIADLVKEMGLQQGEIVADAACGRRARFQPWIESLGYSYVGIDREIPEGSGSVHRFDLNEGFPEIRFDHLICINSLQVFEKPHEFLRHMAGALRKGGKILLTLPNCRSFHYRLWRRMDRFVYHGNSFVNGLSEQDVVDFLEQNGFRLEKKGGVMAFPNQLGLASPLFLQRMWVRTDRWLANQFKGSLKRYSYTYFIAQKI